MTESQNSEPVVRAAPAPRRTARAAGLGIAALTGLILTAGAVAGGAPDSVDVEIDTVSTGGWPLGSTCCPEGPS